MQALFILAGAVSFCAIYFAGRAFRTFIAWADRNPAPKERVGVYLIMAALMGGIAGGLAYSTYASSQQCKANHQPLLPCLMGLNQG
jgi:hypothetical protein